MSGNTIALANTATQANVTAPNDGTGTDHDESDSDYDSTLGSPEWAYEDLTEMVLNGRIDSDIQYQDFYDLFFDNCCLGEDEFEEYWNDHMWEDLSYLYRDFESQYLPGQKPKHPRSVQFVDYEWCSPVELKRFVTRRGLKDPYPPGVTLKYHYLRLLHQADRDWRFRLMDLPPEMRLFIYRDLLLFSTFPGKKACHPAILQTNQQILEEAKGVLYDENVIEVKFDVHIFSAEERFSSAQVHNEYVPAGCTHAPYFRIPNGVEDYPEFLRRITHLEIAVTYDMDIDDPEVLLASFWPLNHYLFTLASFLMGSHRLKTLDVRADIDEEIECGYGTIFYPLRRLRNVRNINISGIPEEYSKKLLKDMKDMEPMYNTMKQWKLLQDEAHAQLDVLKAVNGEPECTCGECDMPHRMEEIIYCLHELLDEKDEVCFGSRLEESFTARLARLRTILARTQTDKLDELVAKLKTKRAAVKEYDAVTDEGRLEEAANIWKGKLYSNEKYGSDHDGSNDSVDVDDELPDIIPESPQAKTIALPSSSSSSSDGSPGAGWGTATSTFAPL